MKPIISYKRDWSKYSKESTGQQTENSEQSNRPGLVKSQSQFLQDKNEKCVFEITMHNDIAFKLLNKIVFHHLDMTQLNFNNVKKFYDEIIF